MSNSNGNQNYQSVFTINDENSQSTENDSNSSTQESSQGSDSQRNDAAKKSAGEKCANAYTKDQLISKLGELKLRISDCPGAPNSMPYYVTCPGHFSFDQHELFVGSMLPQIKFMPKEFRNYLRVLFQGYLYQNIYFRTNVRPCDPSTPVYMPTIPIHCLDEEEIFYYGLIPFLMRLDPDDLLRTRVFTLQNFQRMLNFLAEGRTAAENLEFIQTFQPDPPLQILDLLAETYGQSIGPPKGYRVPTSIFANETEVIQKLAKSISFHPSNMYTARRSTSAFAVHTLPEKPSGEQGEVIRMNPSVWALRPSQDSPQKNQASWNEVLDIIDTVAGTSFAGPLGHELPSESNASHGQSIRIDSATGHVVLMDSNHADRHINAPKTLIKRDPTTKKPIAVTFDMDLQDLQDTELATVFPTESSEAGSYTHPTPTRISFATPSLREVYTAPSSESIKSHALQLPSSASMERVENQKSLAKSDRINASQLSKNKSNFTASNPAVEPNQSIGFIPSTVNDKNEPSNSGAMASYRPPSKGVDKEQNISPESVGTIANMKPPVSTNTVGVSEIGRLSTKHSMNTQSDPSQTGRNVALQSLGTMTNSRIAPQGVDKEQNISPESVATMTTNTGTTSSKLTGQSRQDMSQSRASKFSQMHDLPFSPSEGAVKSSAPPSVGSTPPQNTRSETIGNNRFETTEQATNMPQARLSAQSEDSEYSTIADFLNSNALSSQRAQSNYTTGSTTSSIRDKSKSRYGAFLKKSQNTVSSKQSQKSGMDSPSSANKSGARYENGPLGTQNVSRDITTTTRTTSSKISGQDRQDTQSRINKFSQINDLPFSPSEGRLKSNAPPNVTSTLYALTKNSQPFESSTNKPTSNISQPDRLPALSEDSKYSSLSRNTNSISSKRAHSNYTAGSSFGANTENDDMRTSVRLDPVTGSVMPGTREKTYSSVYNQHLTQSSRMANMGNTPTRSGNYDTDSRRSKISNASTNTIVKMPAFSSKSLRSSVAPGQSKDSALSKFLSSMLSIGSGKKEKITRRAPPEKAVRKSK